EHLVEGVEFDDLITGREDRDEGPAIDAYPCGTDHREHADLGSPDRTPGFHCHVTRPQVFRARANVAPGIVCAQHQDAFAFAPRVLEANHAVCPLRHRGAGHDTDRLPSADAACSERTRRYVLDHV